MKRRATGAPVMGVSIIADLHAMISISAITPAPEKSSSRGLTLNST